MKELNVLVTGCGGDIGQSIGKILKESNLVAKCVGTDISKNHAGLFIYDECFILPRCSDSDYIIQLKNLICDHKIDLVMPISEAEIRYFHKFGIKALGGVGVLIPNSQSLDVGLDKLKTSEFLRISNLIYPQTFTLNESNPLLFPFIAKSRAGSGSKNVFLVENETDLNYIAYRYPDYIVQEYLENSDEEYTCGLFRSKSGETRTLVFRRALMGGFSGFGEVVEDDSIDTLLTLLAQKLDLVGSINVQLRVTERGPCIFEINPRFSSTVRFRDLLGFQDVVWSLQDALGITVGPYNKVAAGKKFYKGFTEFISQ